MLQKSLLPPVIALLFLLPLIGCSEKRVETETTVTSSDGSETYPGHSSTTTERTTEVTDDDDDCGGVLSCTVDVLGNIIALPFRAVGALVDAIF